MDPKIQAAMDTVFTDDTYFPEGNESAKKYGEHAQAAMVILDPENGQVKALYGGYGKKTASNTLNRASSSLMKRQPGSSFKPLSVYAPAIDLQLVTPATIIDDVPVYMLTGSQANTAYPKNDDLQYDGLTSVRNGLKASVNVVAAIIWRDILGADNSINYLKKVGIDRPDEKYVSLALGGLNEGVNPLQMAAAYVPFVHQGMYFEPTTITRVEDGNGNVIIEKKPKYEIVYSEEAASIMTNLLQEVTTGRNSAYHQGGTAASNINKNTIGMAVAGKTGTSNKNIDKWFVGFTPYYVAATWYGYDNKVQPISLTRNEYSQAQKIWAAVMSEIHKDIEPKEFSISSNLVQKKVCIFSGKIASPLCAKDPRGNAVKNEYFIKGTEPRDNDVCTVHVSAEVCSASKDTLGRSLLAGEYCPADTTSTIVAIQRPEPYIPTIPGERAPRDLVYELPAGEYCTVHGAPKVDPKPSDFWPDFPWDDWLKDKFNKDNSPGTSGSNDNRDNGNGNGNNKGDAGGNNSGGRNDNGGSNNSGSGNGDASSSTSAKGNNSGDNS
jgi:penicillin-binding protein 1A